MKEFLKEKHNQGRKILGKRWPDFSQKILKQDRILIKKRSRRAEFLLIKSIRLGCPTKTPLNDPCSTTSALKKFPKFFYLCREIHLKMAKQLKIILLNLDCTLLKKGVKVCSSDVCIAMKIKSQFKYHKFEKEKLFVCYKKAV